MSRKRTPTSDAIDIVHRRYYEGKHERIAALSEARADDEVARKIYQLRAAAGLSQRELAKLVGTTASVTGKPVTPEELNQRLFAAGLISQLPDPSQDLDDDDPADQPITIKGEPLSETIIRERR